MRGRFAAAVAVIVDVIVVVVIIIVDVVAFVIVVVISLTGPHHTSLVVWHKYSSSTPIYLDSISLKGLLNISC